MLPLGATVASNTQQPNPESQCPMKPKAQPQNIITAALWDYGLDPTESSLWGTERRLKMREAEDKSSQSHSVNTDAGSRPVRILVYRPS